MIENNQAEELETNDEIQIEIVDDPPEGQEVKSSSEDELENYTKSVSKRINKLNAKNKQAEDRAIQLEHIAVAKEQELQQYRAYTAQQDNVVLSKESEALQAKEAQIDDVYKKAVQSGDADLMSKATTLKNDISIQKERHRVQLARAQNQAQSQVQAQDQGQYQTYNEQQGQQQQKSVEPTSEALTWHERNQWYGDGENPENLQATQFAYFTHFNLINEGFEPDSDEYYGALDTRVGKVYPNLVTAESSGDNAVQNGSRPAVQRVSSSASPSGRQQTRGNRSGVTFSNSEVERLKGLKPHNMNMETWLRHVAKEKQKISAREQK
jgi:hypothetical protein|tara:strand:+ start:1283 stop:2254 length:972 start_codon:yes stop_codon:yes gene_type:complete